MNRARVRTPARRSGIVACVAVSLCCCADRATAPQRRSADHGSGPDAETVSTVNGARIGVQELQRLAAAGELSWHEALARLQAERLLEAEAAQRGYGADVETRQVVRQALVQELLQREVEAGSIDEATIARAYTQAGPRFQKPEKRAASHVLAIVPTGASEAQERAAHALADQACKQLRASTNPAATIATWKAQHDPQVQLQVEDLPAVANDGSFVPEFMHALFAAPSPGVVPEPVRTSFGWHAIVVTSIQPATALPLAEVRGTLQRELSLQRSKQRMDALLARLKNQLPIQYSEATQKVLAQLDF